MFDTLSDRLSAVFRNLRGKTRLTEADIEEAMGKLSAAFAAVEAENANVAAGAA